MLKIKNIFLPIILAVGAAPLLASCGKIDYVSQCKLSDYNVTTYDNRNFLDNGIGAVELKKCIDGDTTHFNQIEDAHRLVKVRYIGVDTPESTGQIEKWGKAASNFTKEKLESAKTIVLTSDIPQIGQVAQVDSTGSRFKGLVWISEKENAPIAELKCLNLWLVQEGFSFGKGMKDSPLSQFFIDADLQAQQKKLHLYSPESTKDPLYYVGPAVETSLEELSETYEEDGIETSWNGAKIAVEGVVCKLSGQYDCFIIDTNAEGKEYGLFVFAGYKTYSPMRTVGNRVRFVGIYTVYNGNPQLTDVAYNGSFFDAGEDDMKLISKNNPFEIRNETVDNLTNRAAINKVVKVSNLTITGGYTETDKTTQKPSGAFTFNAVDANENEISIRVPSDVWVINPKTEAKIEDWSELRDATVDSVEACINYFASNEDDPYNGYYQLKLCNKDDISITLPTED